MSEKAVMTASSLSTSFRIRPRMDHGGHDMPMPDIPHHGLACSVRSSAPPAERSSGVLDLISDRLDEHGVQLEPGRSLPRV